MRNPVDATPKTDPYSTALRTANNAKATIRVLEDEENSQRNQRHHAQADRTAFRRKFVWEPRLKEAQAELDRLRGEITTFEGQGA